MKACRNGGRYTLRWSQGERGGKDTIKTLNIGEKPVCKSAELRNERARKSLN